MRRFMYLPALLLAVVIISGCQKESVDSAQGSHFENQSNKSSLEVNTIELDKGALEIQIRANEARLAQLGLDATRECVETATVPKDYPTIQAAVDAVCEDGDVIVKAGTYNETVVVYKSGLHIKAIGEVLVNGGFNLLPGTNDVKIHNFTIDMTTSTTGDGIRAVDVNGGEAKQNTVYGTGVIGIRYFGSSNISIKQNHVSGMAWGIFCGDGSDTYMSHNNTISGNTVTGITVASGIGLQGDSDSCLISNNSVTDCSMTVNAGIMVYGRINDKVAENNVIKNNVVKNNTYAGLWLYSGSGNTVGPNNTVNENDVYGILLTFDADGNNIFNNTALNNTPCDISDLSSGTNSLSNNTADCTEGF